MPSFLRRASSVVGLSPKISAAFTPESLTSASPELASDAKRTEPHAEIQSLRETTRAMQDDRLVRFDCTARVAHDLRNSLMGIELAADDLINRRTARAGRTRVEGRIDTHPEARHEAHSEARTKEHLKLIQIQARRMNETLGQLLITSAAANGALPVKLRPVPLGGLLSVIVEYQTQYAERKAQRLTVVAASDWLTPCAPADCRSGCRTSRRFRLCGRGVAGSCCRQAGRFSRISGCFASIRYA